MSIFGKNIYVKRQKTGKETCRKIGSKKGSGYKYNFDEVTLSDFVHLYNKAVNAKTHNVNESQNVIEITSISVKVCWIV